MKDQTRKRTIGVLVLIVIGVGLPFVLSHCLGGPSADNDGKTREITIPSDNNGQSSADTSGKSSPPSSTDSNTSNSSTTNDNPPSTSQSSDNRSKQSSTRQDNESPPSNTKPESGSSFKTPPIKGSRGNNQGARQQSSASADKPDKADNANAAKQGNADSTPEKSSKASSDNTNDQVVNTGSSDQSAAKTSAAASNASANGKSQQKKKQESSADNKPKQSSSSQVRGGSGDWIVQVASFKTRKNARRLISRLKQRYASFYSTGEVNGSTYYRVRVGPFKTHKAAEQAAKDLTSEDHKPYVRRQS